MSRRGVADALARLGRFAWAPHNLIAHPLSEVLHQLGARRLAAALHDWTVPTHEKGNGRG